jgi:hypothetical protein
MSNFEVGIILVYIISSLVAFINGIKQSIIKNNPYGETPYFVWLGIFVWGDGIIIGPFWFFASLFSYFFHDWHLFLLIISVFWIVRSLGEVSYWLNQQFVKNNSNYHQKLIGYKFFKNNAILFIYQIMWQCIAIISILITIKIW